MNEELSINVTMTPSEKFASLMPNTNFINEGKK